MRHITDGELHAYLDGALDHLPDGRGEEVREHLSSCPVCEERLEDERRVRTGAQDLLAQGAPEMADFPPFEEIRARAEALENPAGSGDGGGSPDKGRRTPVTGMPLAWAATVVLAMGVGWMGGEVWRQLPNGAEAPFSGEATPALPAAVNSESRLESRVPDSVLEEAVPESLLRQTDPRPSALGEGGPEGWNEVPEVAAEDFPGNKEATGAVAGDSPRSSAALLEGRTGLADATPFEAEPEKSVPPTRSLGLPSAAPELMEPDNLSPDHSLAVPGLKLLSVEWEEWIPGEQSLRIRQLLPMGDTLELRYLNMLMGTDPSARTRASEERDAGMGDPAIHPPAPQVLEASLPPGWRQVVMRKGRMWLVARAPIPEDQLRALLRSLR